MEQFRKMVNLVSNIAFLVILVGFLLQMNNYQGVGTILIIGWLSYAIVSFLDAILYKGDTKILYFLMLVGVSIASVGILFHQMQYPNSQQILLVGTACALGGAVLILLFKQRFDNMMFRSLLIGAIGLYLLKGFLGF
ncbi:MAG: hypothetical protein MUE81_06160 [Thermoflexibacter sp.]|jgi:hypothetical protein|nr:hypothetical protein [Thermoflexibacter sp.]